MPNNTHKSAAVPFVNQRGERSMKRVKVERYVAGQRPKYAKDDGDDDEEYYTTDEEEEYSGEEEQEAKFHEESGSRFKSLGYAQDDDEDDDDDDEDDNPSDNGGDKSTKQVGNRDLSGQDPTRSNDKNEPVTNKDQEDEESDDDYDEDDPRFRRLREIERSRATTSQPGNHQRTLQIQAKYELGKSVILDEDDDEESIRQRHALARQRQLEAPARPAVSTVGRLDLADDSSSENGNSTDSESTTTTTTKRQRQPKRLDTEDLLAGLKLTGIRRTVREKLKTEEEEELEQRRMRKMLDQARDEAAKTSEILQKVDQDIKREAERLALAKGDIGAREMSSVNTDDEDEELAYEEWKLREIKRVLRDRSERALATNVAKSPALGHYR